MIPALGMEISISVSSTSSSKISNANTRRTSHLILVPSNLSVPLVSVPSVAPHQSPKLLPQIEVTFDVQLSRALMYLPDKISIIQIDPQAGPQFLIHLFLFTTPLTTTNHNKTKGSRLRSYMSQHTINTMDREVQAASLCKVCLQIFYFYIFY